MTSSGILGNLVKLIASKKLSDVPDWTTSLLGSWYLSPDQHGFEFILFNMITISSTLYFFGRARQQAHNLIHSFLASSTENTGDKSGKRPRSTPASKLDRLLFFILFATVSMTILYKARKDTLLFMLQPCHVNIILWILVFVMDRNTTSPHILFNIILHLNWGAVLAIVSPDLRDYGQFLEVEFFWIEHWLLVLIPIYCMARDRYCVLELNISMAAASFFMMATYHSLLLSTVALTTGVNLNYLLAPPPGPLQMFGKYYRVVMYIFCFFLTILMRYILWKGVEEVILRIKKAFGIKSSQPIGQSTKVKK